MKTDDKKSGASADASPDQEVSEIKSNIERTRASMSDTIGALQEKLNPTVLKEKLNEEFEAAKEAVKTELSEAKEAVKGELLEAKDALKDEVREQYEHARTVVHDATIGRVEDMARSATDTVNEARHSFMDTVRENPIPAALAGIGIAWLLMNRRTPRNRTEYRGTLNGPAERGMRQLAGRVSHVAHDVRDQAGDLMHQVGNKADSLAHRAQGQVSDIAGQAGQLAHRVQDQAGEYVGQAGQLAHRVQDQAGQLAHRVQDQAGEMVHYAQDHSRQMVQQTRRTIQSTFEENPLAIGAVALAMGTAIGLALPRTELEDEWLGDARDQLMDKVGEVAHESLGQAKQAVEQLVSGETQQADGNASASKSAAKSNEGQKDDAKKEDTNKTDGAKADAAKSEPTRTARSSSSDAGRGSLS